MRINKAIVIGAFAASVFMTICVVAGYVMSMYTVIKWIPGSLFVASILVMIGTWAYEDDASSMIDDVSRNPVEKISLAHDIRRNNTINYLLILVLWVSCVVIQYLL